MAGDSMRGDRWWRRLQGIRAIGLVVCGFCLSANASEVEILTWSNCVHIAREHEPGLISATLAVEQAREGLRSAQASRYPSASVSASAGRSGDSSGSDDSYGADASGQQLLFDGGRTRNSIGAARDAETLSVAQLDAASAGLRESLRDAFIDLLRAEELQALTARIADRRRQSLDLVKLRYEAGREHHGSLQTAEANVEQAEMNIRSAARSIDVTRVALLQAMGRAASSAVQATGNLNAVVLIVEKPDFEKVADKHPTLRQLAARKSSAEHALAGVKADGMPQATASARDGLSGANWPPDKASWSVGVSVSLPVFEGGKRMASVRSHRAALKSAEEDELAGRLTVIASLVQSWAGLEGAVDAVAVQEKFLSAAEERAKIAEAQYSSGLITFDNWIIIEDQLVQSMTSLLDARVAALKADAHWTHACGGTLEDE